MATPNVESLEAALLVGAVMALAADSERTEGWRGAVCRPGAGQPVIALMVVSPRLVVTASLFFLSLQNQLLTHAAVLEFGRRAEQKESQYADHRPAVVRKRMWGQTNSPVRPASASLASMVGRVVSSKRFKSSESWCGVALTAARLGGTWVEGLSLMSMVLARDGGIGEKNEIAEKADTGHVCDKARKFATILLSFVIM